MRKKVYISYRWKEPVEGIARNWLWPSIDNAGFECIIDVKDCSYKARIDRFEKEIGKAERVVMLLSDRFFYSDQCMYEAALVTKEGDLEGRLFPVNIGDYEHSDTFYSKLLDYWDEEEAKAQSELSRHSFGRQPFEEKCARMKLIKEQIGKFWLHVSQENFLNFSSVSKGNFEMIIKLFAGMTKVAELNPVTPDYVL